MGKYTKAIMAAVVAGGTAYLNAQADGVLTGEDIGAIVAAVLVAAGFVWAVPNDKGHEHGEDRALMITAKIQCQSKQETGDGDQRQVAVTFVPDYADGRNKEWSLYTPALSLSMTLKGEVADRFEPGQRYTLQFVEETEAAG